MKIFDFSISQLRDMNVVLMWLEKDKFNLNPIYQREGDVWSLEKRQLLIDSIINEFDIPKIYVHELDKPKVEDGKIIKYAIIDGKQRLQTMWQFMENKWPISDDFVYLNDKSLRINGMYYKDLAAKQSKIYAKFNAQPLTVVSVKTTDTDLIEEMFSRLNEAVALNAPEKRNSLRGPIPLIIREVIRRPFFEDRFPVSKKRYRHHDLACKFLYLEYKKGPATTSKNFLDEFVLEFRNKKMNKEAKSIERRVKENLKQMETVFGTKDHLLRNVGTAVVYYLLFREATQKGFIKKLDRETMENFDADLEKTRAIADKDITKVDPALMEFIHLSQSLNNVSAMEYKLEVLKKYLLKKNK